jgi:hypothetical protein
LKRELYPLTYDPEWTDPCVVVSNNQVVFNPNYEPDAGCYITFETVRDWPELRFELSFVTDASEEGHGELIVYLYWKTDDVWEYWEKDLPVPIAPGAEYTEYVYYPNVSNAHLEAFLWTDATIRCTAYVKNISSSVLGTASEVAKGSVTKTYNSTNYVEAHRFKAAYAGDSVRSPISVEFDNRLWKLVQYNNTVNYPAGVEMPYVEKGYTAYYVKPAPLHWIYSEPYLETKGTTFRGGSWHEFGRGNVTTPSVLWEIQRSDGESHFTLLDDIDKDGKIEIIAAFIGWTDGWNTDGIICYDNEGNQKWRAYTRYTANSDQWTEHPITMTLFDVNGDGYKEILVSTYESCYLHCFDHEGNELWRNQNIPGGMYVMEHMTRLNCKDVNDDGVIEMFEAPWDSRIYCRRADTGEQIWVTQVERNPGNFEKPGYSAIADIDNDGVDEVVVGHWNNRYLYCLNSLNGNIKWRTSENLYASKLLLHDFNNDGLLEIFVATSIEGHDVGYPKIYKPDGTLLAASTAVINNTSMAIFIDENNNPYIGACHDYQQKLKVISYDRNSNSLNVNEKTFSGIGSIHHIVSADINNDGAYEILYLYDHGILCVDKNLNQLWNYNIPSRTVAATYSMAVDDVNGDGYLEIIFSSYDNNYSYLTVLKGG